MKKIEQVFLRIKCICDTIVVRKLFSAIFYALVVVINTQGTDH